MMAPIAIMVTADVPDTAPNTVSARMVATARPPGIGLVMATMKRVSRPAMAPRAMTSPAMTNNGIDSSTSRSTVFHMSWIRNSIELLVMKAWT